VHGSRRSLHEDGEVGWVDEALNRHEGSCYPCLVQWVYKATSAKVDYVSTLILADRRGFLCRSAHSDNGAWVSNVRDVSAGDLIHFYYVRPGKKPGELGSFEVLAAGDHQNPDFFGDCVDGTAICRVKDPALIKHLVGLGGYQPDPILHSFTGWPIRKVGPAAKYHPAMFTARATLQQYDPGR
jgi:hypothetical protein